MIVSNPPGTLLKLKLSRIFDLIDSTECHASLFYFIYTLCVKTLAPCLRVNSSYILFSAKSSPFYIIALYLTVYHLAFMP